MAAVKRIDAKLVTPPAIRATSVYLMMWMSGGVSEESLSPACMSCLPWSSTTAKGALALISGRPAPVASMVACSRVSVLPSRSMGMALRRAAPSVAAAKTASA